MTTAVRTGIAEGVVATIRTTQSRASTAPYGSLEMWEQRSAGRLEFVIGSYCCSQHVGQRQECEDGRGTSVDVLSTLGLEPQMVGMQFTTKELL